MGNVLCSLRFLVEVIQCSEQRVSILCLHRFISKSLVVPDLLNLRKEFLRRLLEASTERCVLET